MTALRIGPRVASERGGIVLFLGAVTALSIPFWIAGAALKRPEGVPLGLSAGSLMIVAPVVAACVLTGRTSGLRGVGRLLRQAVEIRGVGWRWYAAACLTVPAILTASWFLLVLSGRLLPEPALDVAALPALVAVYAIAAAAEEIGWTGYAIDRMLSRWTPLRSALLLGGFTAVWHVIAIAEAGRGPAWIAWQCLFLIAVRVPIVWIYRGTGGSLLAAILFHTTINVGASVFPNRGSAYDPALAAIVTVVAAAAIATVALRARPAGRERRVGGVRPSAPSLEPEGVG